VEKEKIAEGIYKRGGNDAQGPWYATWVDHAGKRHVKSTKTTDKATANRILAKYKADAALRREGVIDTAEETVICKPKRCAGAAFRMPNCTKWGDALRVSAKRQEKRRAS